MTESEPNSIEINERNLRDICRLLGDIALLNSPIDNKRRVLLDGLSELVEADGWIWTCAAVDPERNCPVPMSFLFGGVNKQQVAALLDSFSDTSTADPCNEPLAALVSEGHHVVRTRRQLTDDDTWYNSDYTKTYFLRHGIEDPMYAITPLSDQSYSAVCLFRFTGRPPFSERQRRIVNIVTTEVRWLGNSSLPARHSEAVFGLTPRLRSVLALLIDGQTCNEIAGLYHLSPHTIKGYIRDIYRHFNINSQIALIRLFRDKQVQQQEA